MFSLSQHLVLHSPVQERMHKYPSEHANVVMLKFFFQVFFNVLRPSLRVQQKNEKLITIITDDFYWQIMPQERSILLQSHAK